MTRAISGFRLLFLMMILLQTRLALAGTVRAVSKEKSMVAVDLAEGEKPGRNAKICFYSTAHKKLACGTAIKLKGSILIVKVDKKLLPRISKGLTASIDGAPAAAPDSGDMAASSGDDTPDIAKTIKSRKKPPLRVALGWDFALVTPATYNELSYSYQPAGASAPTTLWQTSKTVSSGLVPPTYIVYSGEVGIPIGMKALNIGFRYQLFQANLVTSDFTPGVLEPYVSTEVKGSAVGVWGDYQYYRAQLSSVFALNLMGGLDYDATTVTLSAIQLTDGTAGSIPVANATGKLALLSGRVGARLDALILPPVGISLGVTALVPVFAMTNSFSSTIGPALANVNIATADEQTDLKNSVGLKKKSFGLEAILSTYVNF